MLTPTVSSPLICSLASRQRKSYSHGNDQRGQQSARAGTLIHHKPTRSPEFVCPSPSDGFVVTPQVEQLIARGFFLPRRRLPGQPFRPGRQAERPRSRCTWRRKLERPVTLIHGDDEFGSSDLVGNDNGYRKNRLVDNYIHSVLKEEETMRTLWIDNRLTTACRYGHTLVYDELTAAGPRPTTFC